MKRHLLSLSLAALALISSVGCGGGGGNGSEDATVSRSLLTGGNSRVWRVDLVHANTNYVPSSSNPNTFYGCPYNFTWPDGTAAPVGCGATDTITFFENGQVEYKVGASPANGTWSLSGSTLSMQFGGSLGTTTDQIEVRKDGRLTLRRIQRDVGGVVQATEAQNAYIIANP